jgi:hypothetical protein
MFKAAFLSLTCGALSVCPATDAFACGSGGCAPAPMASAAAPAPAGAQSYRSYSYEPAAPASVPSIQRGVMRPNYNHNFFRADWKVRGNYGY